MSQPGIAQWRAGRVVVCCVLLLALAVLLFSLPAFVSLVTGMMAGEPVDMKIFARQGEAFWRTGQLYQRSDNIAFAYLPNAAVYKFPPTYQLYVAPWLQEGIPPVFFRCVHWSGLASYLAGLAIFFWYCIRLVPVRFALQAREARFLLALLCAAIALQFSPFFNAYMLGAVELQFLLVFSLLFLLLESSPRLAGCLLALAVTAKIYPLFLLSVIVWQRNWPALRSFAVTTVLLSLAALAVFGAEEVVYYSRNILPLLLAEHPMGISENLHLVFFLFPDGITHRFAEIFATCLRLGFLSAWLLVLLMFRPGNRESNAIMLSLGIVTMIIAMPNCWLQYYVMLLLPAVLVLAKSLSGGQVAPLLLASIALLAMTVSREPVYPLLLMGFEGGLEELYLQVAGAGEQAVLLRHAPVAWLVAWLDTLKPLVPYLLWLSLMLLLFSGRPAAGQRLPENSFFSSRSFRESVSANPMRAR